MGEHDNLNDAILFFGAASLLGASPENLSRFEQEATTIYGMLRRESAEDTRKVLDAFRLQARRPSPEGPNLTEEIILTALEARFRLDWNPTEKEAYEKARKGKNHDAYRRLLSKLMGVFLCWRAEEMEAWKKHDGKHRREPGWDEKHGVAAFGDRFFLKAEALVGMRREMGLPPWEKHQEEVDEAFFWPLKELWGWAERGEHEEGYERGEHKVRPETDMEIFRRGLAAGYFIGRLMKEKEIPSLEELRARRTGICSEIGKRGSDETNRKRQEKYKKHKEIIGGTWAQPQFRDHPIGSLVKRFTFQKALEGKGLKTSFPKVGRGEKPKVRFTLRVGKKWVPWTIQIDSLSGCLPMPHLVMIEHPPKEP